MRRGGKAKGISPRPITRVMPAPIRLVDWDAIEAREKSGEKVTPATVPYMDERENVPAKATKAATIFD